MAKRRSLTVMARIRFCVVQIESSTRPSFVAATIMNAIFEAAPLQTSTFSAGVCGASKLSPTYKTALAESATVLRAASAFAARAAVRRTNT